MLRLCSDYCETWHWSTIYGGGHYNDSARWVEEIASGHRVLSLSNPPTLMVVFSRPDLLKRIICLLLSLSHVPQWVAKPFCTCILNICTFNVFYVGPIEVTDSQVDFDVYGFFHPCLKYLERFSIEVRDHMQRGRRG